MHELGIMTSVMDAVEKSAHQAGATRVLKVSLSIGEMTEAIEDSLRFAWEVLTEGTDAADAELSINMVRPKSKCYDCGAEFEHDRFHMACPECGSYATELIAGRELQIDSIEVDIPDGDDEGNGEGGNGGGAPSDGSNGGNAPSGGGAPSNGNAPSNGAEAAGLTGDAAPGIAPGKDNPHTDDGDEGSPSCK